MRTLAALLCACASLSLHAMDEVPFVVSPDNVTLTMLEMAQVRPEDYLIDLGSGDGRIVITAAKRFGARGLGVEIDPKLVEQSRHNAQRAGVGAKAFFREQDLFKTDLSPASVITMYLLPDVNLELRPKLLRLRPGTRIVSHDYDLGDWKPDRTIVVDVPDKPVGAEKKSRIHYWVVPARVEGDWCGTGKARGVTLRLAQEYQRFRARFERGGEGDEFFGTIEGTALKAPKHAIIRTEGEKLRVQAIARTYLYAHGALFTRARGPTCK